MASNRCLALLALFAALVSSSEKSAEVLESPPDPLAVVDEPEVKCHYGGKTYKEGEEIKTDRVCFHCTCRKGWTEPSSLQCAIIDCPWGYYQRRPYCKKTYVEGKCCPELSCSPPPPQHDPAYLNGKRSTLSTDNYIIMATPNSEVNIYCVVDNSQNETAEVRWTKTTHGGQEVPLFESSMNVINGSFDNRSWGLLLERVTENDAGIYTCHVATDPPQTQKTELRISNRRSFRRPECLLPPTEATTAHGLCAVNSSAWGYYYDEHTYDCVKHKPQCGSPSANNFASRSECWDNCLDGCLSEEDTGECHVQVERYSYNDLFDSCHRFSFNGCRGNRNNFRSKNECLATCASVRFLRFEGKDSTEIEEDSGPLHCSVGCSWRLWVHHLVRGCRPVFEPRACCPTRFDCSPSKQTETDKAEETGDEAFKCIQDGRNYTLNEDILLKNDCQICTCTHRFKGPGSPDCRPLNECNTIEMKAKLAEGCQPVYVENNCCPTSWQCPIKDTSYRQKGPHVFFKEPPELQCQYGGREYPRWYSLITGHGFCRSCICLTPPDFTCIDTVCPPHPSTLNETLRCESVLSVHYTYESCCPEYKCWDILENSNYQGKPQTNEEKEFCNNHPCSKYDVCRINYTACYRGECQRTCQICPVPMCVHGTIYTPPYECPTCRGYGTPEEACTHPECPVGSTCTVDEDECRQGNCQPKCFVTQEILLIRENVQMKNSTDDEKACPSLMCPDHCRPSAPDDRGCSINCNCPKTSEEACKNFECPQGSVCLGECNDNICSPVCQLEILDS